MGNDYLNLPGIPGSGEPPEIPGVRDDPSSELAGVQSGPALPGSEPEPAPHRPWLWAELALASALAVLLGLAGLGFVLGAAGAHAHTGTSRSGQVISAVVSLGLFVLCTRWAIGIEHRLRRHQPVAHAFAAGATATAPALGTAVPALSATAAASAPSRRHATRRRSTRLGNRRHYGPVSTAITMTVLIGAVVGFTVGAISSYSQGVRSAYVQSHGVTSGGVVDSVDNTQHCSRGGCYYTAAIDVTLSAPVSGTTRTTAHYPGYSNLVSGEQVSLLVDPKQPGYAELPGSRFVTSWEWILFTVMAVLFAGVALLFVRALRRQLAHRSAHLAKSAS